MKKHLVLFAFLVLILNAKTNKELLEEALKLEKAKNYKEAMQIYKKLAIKNNKIKYIYLDEEKKKAQNITSNTLNKIEDEETRMTIEQILASSFNLYPYKENYLLPFSYDTKGKNDRDQKEVKFQISFKKPIFHNIFNLNETLNFGYTQTSWWQLYDESAPFRETNYQPEVFLEIPYGKKNKTFLKGFKLGFIHESNGQNKEESRSWNRLYLTSYFQKNNLFIIPKIWYRIKEKDDDNPDIHKYLGYGDLTLAYPYKNHTFKLLLRNNLRKKNKSFTQFDWTFPLFNLKKTFGYVQGSTGYGDSLIDYNKKINRLSIGISLSR